MKAQKSFKVFKRFTQFEDAPPRPKNMKYTQKQKVVVSTDKCEMKMRQCFKVLFKTFTKRKPSEQIKQAISRFGGYFSDEPRELPNDAAENLNQFLHFGKPKIAVKPSAHTPWIAGDESDPPDWNDDSDVENNLQSREIDAKIKHKAALKFADLKPKLIDKLAQHQIQFLQDCGHIKTAPNHQRKKSLSPKISYTDKAHTNQSQEQVKRNIIINEEKETKQLIDDDEKEETNSNSKQIQTKSKKEQIIKAPISASQQNSTHKNTELLSNKKAQQKYTFKYENNLLQDKQFNKEQTNESTKYKKQYRKVQNKEQDAKKQKTGKTGQQKQTTKINWSQYETKQVKNMVNSGQMVKLSAFEQFDKVSSSSSEADDVLGQEKAPKIKQVGKGKETKGVVYMETNEFSAVAEKLGLRPLECVWVISDHSQKYQVTTEYMDKVYRKENMCATLPYVSLNQSQFILHDTLDKQINTLVPKKKARPTYKEKK